MNTKLSVLPALLAAFLFGSGVFPLQAGGVRRDRLAWRTIAELPEYPDGGRHHGVAGPFVGVVDDALLVAGGANFPDEPLWETDKVFHDEIHLLRRLGDGYEWHSGGTLPSKMGYGAAVTTPDGIVCMGGTDDVDTFDEVFLISWNENSGELEFTEFPSLPEPCAYGSATLIGDRIYLAGGMSDLELSSAMNNFWMLDLSMRGSGEDFKWVELDPVPGPSRAFNITVSQHNGFDYCVYVMSGRAVVGDDVAFLTDVYEYNPARAERGRDPWRQRADVPHCVMAGTGIRSGQSHIHILGGADGSLFGRPLGDDHPGFFRESLSYHTITDTWAKSGYIPSNQVTTIPVRWGSDVVIASGETRPRVRSPKIWSIGYSADDGAFGLVNYIVLIGYLLGMVAIGAYFAKKNKNTDDYFRGGKKIIWWAAGCSIFATMLSSLTYTGIPSKAFAQDWVYLIGNLMIFFIAPMAIYIALPFFREIDATSAYEYMEKRFNRAVRLFSSASFTLFHIFRMGVVMSLTALALAVATPLSPEACVLIMGVLSIIYCTMGGVEAVIWTDTVQTVVLLGGGMLAFVLLVVNVDGGFSGFIATGVSDGKFHMVNIDFASDSYMRMAIWVVILGAFGQNISSYTADQAVVQRYMTTENEKVAAKSIWTNAILAVPASLLFYALGSALYAFYKTYPDRLDPTITTDQIFPLFIANEMPTGIAGLIVAGIFAAAQSTVSTSMNSTATTVVTDFMRPLGACKTEATYLRWARLLTLIIGVLGTMIGLIFVSPEIKSLFDSWIRIIGLFMGVLGGLFLLGIFTRRANGAGALVGAVFGAAVMFWLGVYTNVNGYMYAFCGIVTCFVVGYLASMLLPGGAKDIAGLTFHTLRRRSERIG